MVPRGLQAGGEEGADVEEALEFTADLNPDEGRAPPIGLMDKRIFLWKERGVTARFSPSSHVENGRLRAAPR